MSETTEQVDHPTINPHEELATRTVAAERGGSDKQRQKQVDAGKMLVRDRLALLFDDGWSFEDGLLARFDEGLPGDAVVTCVGDVDGRPVCVIANDYTVKAGTWGKRTYEKIVRTAGARRLDRCAAGLPVRLCRRPHRRAVRELRRSPRLGQHLLQPGPVLRPGAAGLRPVRAFARGIRVRPGTVRPHHHGAGPCHRLPWIASAGPDGDR